MADYWKSQERKYCDFCKCWIADNKPSVEFHEKGRRHKLNVEKRIKTIHKQSRKDEKETIKVDAAIRHMESAGLQAYKFDIANNADLTGKVLNKKLEEEKLADSTGKKLWHEAKSNSGQTYYWNTMTNESVWEPPEGGYLSIAEQRQVSLDATKKQMKAINKHNILHERIRSAEEKQLEEEERAKSAREKMKERKVEAIPEVVLAPIIPPGKSTPYGRWETVKTYVPVLDLQLPQQPEYEEPDVIEQEPELPQKHFKEKVVESLGSSNVGFKKRKIGAGAKRNTRQRMDDE